MINFNFNWNLRFQTEIVNQIIQGIWISISDLKLSLWKTKRNVFIVRNQDQGALEVKFVNLWQ